MVAYEQIAVLYKQSYRVFCKLLCKQHHSCFIGNCDLSFSNATRAEREVKPQLKAKSVCVRVSGLHKGMLFRVALL